MAESNAFDLDSLELQTMIGFGGSLMAGLRCHPDRHHLVYGVGSTVVVENIDTGKQDFLVAHTNTVSCVTISKSGRFIASGQVTYSGFKAEIVIWDFELRELYAKLQIHRNSIQALDFTFDDRYLMSLGGQDDGPCVIVWNVTAKDAICGSPAQKKSDGLPYVIACANNSNDMFVTAGRGTVRVWQLDVEDRKINPTDIRLRKFVRVSRCIAIDDTDTFFYLGTTTGDIIKVSIPSCKMAGHGPEKDRFMCGISSIALLKNGEIIVGCGDGTVGILTHDFRRTGRETTIEGMVSSIALRGIGTQFYIGTAASNIYSITNLGTVLTPKLIKTSHYEAITGLDFPYACSELIATCSMQEIRLWYIKTKQEVMRIVVPNHTCNAISIMKDGKSIVSGWSDCRIRAFYPESGKPMYMMASAYGAEVTAIATFSNCQKIVSGSDLGHVVVWNVPQWRATNDLNYASKHLLLKEHKARVTCIKISNDDNECVSSSIDGSCVVWDLINKHRRHMLRVNTLFQNVCYHPLQHQLLTTGTDRKVAFWETYDASKIRELEGSLSGSVNAMDISTDGEYFVTGGDDKLLKLWKYEEGEVTHIGRGHSAPIKVICISPNESFIVSVSSDGAILFWKFPSSAPEPEPDHEMQSVKPGAEDEMIPTLSPSKETKEAS